MADYKCTYRTNYFQVTDEEQYEKTVFQIARERSGKF